MIIYIYIWVWVIHYLQEVEHFYHQKVLKLIFFLSIFLRIYIFKSLGVTLVSGSARSAIKKPNTFIPIRI